MQQLFLHCYAEYANGYWTAYCLDLTLYATGDSLEEARSKLDEEIIEYVNAATIGRDAQFFDQLIPRKAPWGAWFKYYIVSIKYYLYHIVFFIKQYPNLINNLELFNEMRLIPKHGHSPKAPFGQDLITYMARQAGVSKSEFYQALED